MLHFFRILSIEVFFVSNEVEARENGKNSTLIDLVLIDVVNELLKYLLTVLFSGSLSI